MSIWLAWYSNTIEKKNYNTVAKKTEILIL